MGPDNNPDAHRYISFGPSDTDEIRHEWAERMLTMLKERHPGIFGALLQEALGIEPRKRRG